MRFDNFEIHQNVGFINADYLQPIILEDYFSNHNLKTLVVYMNENMIDSTNLVLLEAILMKIPYITIGILGDMVGPKTIQLATRTHIRVALASSRYEINVNNLKNISNISILLGSSKSPSLERLSGKIDKDGLLAIGFISKIFDNSHCDEFSQWLKNLVLNKDEDQLKAIKKCFDRYRLLMPKINDRGILVKEESKQFCLLASRGMENR